jgi:hypothetical protein
MPVSLDIETPTTTDKNGSDVTPTNNSPLTGQDTGKVTGSAGNDRATLFDVQKDSDQVIKLGAGDDVFVFGPNDTKVDLNGIVFMGENNLDDDRVFLNHRVQDYVFTTRSDGGIKIQYVGEPAPDNFGDAITFYQAEQFIFRNIAPDGTNFTNQAFTQDDLYALILAAEAV